jgi:octaprenyl-diphosphate synthase
VRKEEILLAIKDDLLRIEEVLKKNFSSYVPFINQVSEYILFAGGKRLRPLLMVLCARLCQSERDPYRISVLFEYLHAATLLHDDVVDSAAFRRGRKAAHHLWGNQAVILVGDFLYSRAIRIAVEEGDMDVLDVISRTTTLMSEGEVLQLINLDNVALTEEEYLEVIYRKTAVLISAACEVGAIFAGSNGWEREALREYGKFLGYAFQITDDLLDYVGSSQETGKEVGNDFKEGKVTLPFILALEQAHPEDRDRLLQLIKREEPTLAHFEEAKTLIEKYQGFERTRKRAEEFVHQALAHLAPFPSSETKTLLEGIARYVLTRRH